MEFQDLRTVSRAVYLECRVCERGSHLNWRVLKDRLERDVACQTEEFMIYPRGTGSY